MKKYFSVLILGLLSQVFFGQKTILWKITDTINSNTSYMVGTFHQFGNSFVDSIPEIKESLYASDLAIFESVDKVNKTRIMINSREKSLEIKKRLKKKDYQLLLKLSKDWEVDIHKVKPIELRWKLQQEFMKIKCNTVQKNDKWDHFDNYLISLAEEKSIETFGLETDEEQLNLINREYDSPSWKDEKKRISYLLNQLDRDDFNRDRCNFATKYRNYDLDYKLDIACKSNILIKERNDNWMQVLPGLLRENKCFIAVGLLHLYNTCGLLEQLKNNGFIVEPIVLVDNKN